MDHLIEQIIDYMQQDVDRLKEEYENGCECLKDCPSYPSVKVCCDAIKALNRLDGRYDAYTSPERILEQGGFKIDE